MYLTGFLANGIPTFPLNTDGIDPRGANVLIENVYIENFDDAVAVKPANQGDTLSQCSQNMLIRNCTVVWSVGMTIGSVPPNKLHACIRNITFEDIQFKHPLKALYIKTNPGDEGDGTIDGITYRNIHVDTALWYPLWFGPQQQKQPGTKGNGCSFLYPIVKTCPTQPRVPITNVLVENVLFENGVTLPGVMICNSTVPCTGFEFRNVTNTGMFLVQKEYVCENVIHSTHSGSVPAPGCF